MGCGGISSERHRRIDLHHLEKKRKIEICLTVNASCSPELAAKLGGGLRREGRSLVRPVIPANAGNEVRRQPIHLRIVALDGKLGNWIPAFAGMTIEWNDRKRPFSARNTEDRWWKVDLPLPPTLGYAAGTGEGSK
jgi:hypothetical protein